MSTPVSIILQESLSELKLRHSKSPVHLRPRLKMLVCIANGVHLNSTLAAKTGAGLRSIIRWKKTYTEGGIDALLGDARGGDYRSGITADGKEKLQQKLAETHDAFTSYGQIRDWIASELKVEMKYMAVYTYLRRNFDTKLKVGRRSHVKKEEGAEAFFKNAAGKDNTYK